MLSKAKIGINGYGTIGKRVADAVAKQDDMEVVGVTKTRPDFKSKLAVKKGYPLYVAIPERTKLFEQADIPYEGTIHDLLEKVDLIVDCSPGGIGAKNKPMYEKAGVKAIFEGGEAHEVAGFSFNALCNYDQAIGRDFVRVVSCNTTGLCRTLNAVDKAYGAKKIRAVMIRRAADPAQTKKGPINAIIPDPPTISSHHGPDVNTVIPHLKIVTMATKIPTTIMHLHSVMVELENKATAEDVIKIFNETPRVMLVSAEEGITSTAQIIELGRDLLRPRYDIYEICVWKESVSIKDNELYYFQAIHQESNVVPENIDAIRAMLELETDAMKSINKTNEAMGIM